MLPRLELLGGPRDGLILEVLKEDALDGLFVLEENNISSHYVRTERFAASGYRIYEFKEYVYYEPITSADTRWN